MKIQRFADVYDEMIEDVNKQKNRTQQELNNLAGEKQTALDTYEQNYQNQLTNYDNLMEQQQNYIDTWANTQKETQQKQYEYETNLINQAKQDAEKQTNAEIGNAYIDYQKSLNQFGGTAEILASQGLSGTGFAKNEYISMNVTYQNRVSTAKNTLTKANTEFNNQLLQASMNNDAALAQFALQQMEKTYLLALQGFEYKTSMENNRLNYIQGINDSYFGKTNTLQGRLDDYNNMVNSIKEAREDANLKKQQIAYQAEQDRKQMAWERERFYAQLNAEKEKNNIASLYSDSSSSPVSTTSSSAGYPLVTKYYKGEYNKDALTNGKVDKDKVFSNGYQPNNINGNKLVKSGYKVSDMFGEMYGSTGANLNEQNIWASKNHYYVWDGSQNKYIDVTEML